MYVGRSKIEPETSGMKRTRCSGFRLNSHVVRFLERRKKNSSALRNGAASNAELDDGCDATAVLLKKGKLFMQLGTKNSGK